MWKLILGSCCCSHTLQLLPPLSGSSHFTCSWWVQPQRWATGILSGYKWRGIPAVWLRPNRYFITINVQTVFCFMWFHLWPSVDAKYDTSFCNINRGQWKNRQVFGIRVRCQGSSFLSQFQCLFFVKLIQQLLHNSTKKNMHTCFLCELFWLTLCIKIYSLIFVSCWTISWELLCVNNFSKACLASTSLFKLNECLAKLKLM